MIKYGICVGNDPARYTAKNFLKEVHYTREDQTSICEAYNSIIDECSPEDTLVLLHEDLEVKDQEYFESKVQFFQHRIEDIAILGAAGALHPPGLQWWKGKQLIGLLIETRGVFYGDFSEGYVHTVDGCIMVLYPWSLQNLRFDEKNFPHFHGYDIDLCCQALLKGKKVCVGVLNLHHNTKVCECEGPKHDCGFGDTTHFDEANKALARKWG